MAAFKGDSIFWVEVEKIVPNPYQPRREFDESKLKELSESIRMYGVLQPLTVSRVEVPLDNGAFKTEYELIAGERRLRASKLAGLAQVPVIIREGDDSEQEKLELAIIENLQREDLNAVDRALAFRQLADVFGLSHSQVAKKVGRSREYVSNTIRLLNLPDYMLQSLKEGDITEGHARTLLMLNDRPEEQDTVYREILLKKLSVREVERIARKIATDKVRSKKWQNSDPELIEKEKEFTETLGTRVQIAKTDYGGKITIDYFSEDDLEHLLGILRQQTPEHASVGAISAVAAEIKAVSDESDRAIASLAASTPLSAESHADEVVHEVEESAAESEIPAPQSAPESTPATSHVPETEPEPVSTPEPVAEVTPESVPEASIEPETPIEEQQPEAPVSPLRAKLSQLFAQQAAAPAKTPEPAPVEDTAPAVEVPEPQTESTPTPPAEPKKESAPDTAETDLYNFKNFTI